MRRALPYLLAFFVPFAVYAPTLSGTFYYDDNVIFFGHQVSVLAQNPFLVFKGQMHYIPGAPRSVHVFFLLLIYKAFGPNPLPYHLFNLVLHSATSLLVFIFIKRLLSAMAAGGILKEMSPEGKGSLTPPAALAGGLVFGLHPVHLENITFVTLGGTDLFYTLWAMLSLVLYMGFRASRSGLRFVSLLLSACAFYLALMSKESAAVFILIYPLTELLLGKRGFLWALPHAAALALFKGGLIFKTVSSAVSVAGSRTVAGGGLEGMLKSLGFFMKSLIFPYPHLPFIKEFGSAGALYLFLALGALALIAGLVLKKRLLSYSLLWIGIISVPYLFVPSVQYNVAVTAERYIYGPSVGFAVLAAAAALRAPRRLMLPALSLLLVLYGTLGVGYFYRAWRTEETFWKYAIETNPGHVSGYISLAAIELNKGNAGRAHDLLLEGLGKPKGMPSEFSQAAYSIGDIARRSGDLMRAESYYLLSLRYGPYEFSYMELGFLYLETGNVERAKWAFEGAAGFPSRNVRALYGLAYSSKLLGDREGARRYAMQVIERARDERLRALAAEILKD